MPAGSPWPCSQFYQALPRFSLGITGREVPSGAYFYRLSGPEKALTDKMMLVR